MNVGTLLIRQLFLEYAQSLGFSLCFQGFDKEVASLPGDYAPPGGCLVIARSGGEVAGCVGVRPLDRTRCEMKRLYVKPMFRGRGWGRRLAEAAITRARAAGYRRMYLDTLPAMKEARALYASLDFKPCAPYYDNTCLGSDCFELKL
ncbi:MAG: GNAT family N-acetyltransferase [Betaproteobacteria bacterium]|nr:GNAT family N-acetyltransferase [Betaproteobacteria bacterium]